ncbi:MAG: methyltransferase domain-containing protein [Deltaproteobacteria bacterium]|nr:MAG: methyltransferase domain-containing protein [Deltaproteobacteria bacterium]
MSYLDTVHDVYKAAAEAPDNQLCCISTPPWNLPDLEVPEIMWEMNYGCGTTVQPRDIPKDGPILYIGVGGGLELLQFASLARRPGAVIGVDTVPEMIETCRRNFGVAKTLNPWLVDDMVEVRHGDALDLPVEDGSVALVAQNCLFNVFRDAELKKALSEAHRVLREGGALSLSDPVCDKPIPEALRNDERLRAQCISGAIPLQDYLDLLVETGFGTIEVRARRPYRMLDKRRYDVPENILLESVEVVAYKTPVPADGACIFTGRFAIWTGDDELWSDGKGHDLVRDVPLGVCDKTGGALESLDLPDLFVTPRTWHYAGGGCC